VSNVQCQSAKKHTSSNQKQPAKKQQNEQDVSYLGVNQRDLSGVSSSDGVPTGPSMLCLTINQPTNQSVNLQSTL